MPGDEIQELHQRRSTHNQRQSDNPNRQSINQHHNQHHHDGQGHADNKAGDNSRRATIVEGATIKMIDDDNSSSSRKSNPIEMSKFSPPQGPRHSVQSGDSGDDHGRGHSVHIAGQGEVAAPLSTPIPDTKKIMENLARASWTTASFTEVPNALDELTEQHHPSRTSAAENRQKRTSQGNKTPKSSAGDLHSILVKHGQQPMESTLTKYLRPTMSDEGTQAGIPSWDWLSRLEQMLIHFFLMIFESSGDDSTKLVMEMMPTEAGQQVEEIFQLLLKAEPDMYKELGHLVHLAEKWLIHWKGDSEERQKALEYVRLYMQGVKDKNYYRLPIQVRLHKLGAFIAGLKTMNKDVSGYPVYVKRPSLNQMRVASPRVKPGTHFSRVVANILCGRTCEDPFPIEDIYADKLGRQVFQKPLHGDKEFRKYTDEKYGPFYLKKDLFSMRRARKSMRDDDGGDDGGGAGDADEEGPRRAQDREDCLENLNCWVPMYTKAYVKNLKGNGCEVFAKADFSRDLKIKACKSETCANKVRKGKSKKLYDWVKGADGKVYRRAVGSYTELGGSGSMDRLPSRGDRSPGRHGVKKGASGKRFNNKTYGGGGGGPGGGPGGNKSAKGLRVGYAAGKAVSDTRLGQNDQGSKGKDGRQSMNSKGKTLTDGGTDDRSKKYKGGRSVAGVYQMDGMSVDGSGDSAHEDLEGRHKYGGGGGAGNERDRRKQDGDRGDRDRYKDTQSRHSQYGDDRYSVSRYGSTRHGVGGRGGGERGGGGGTGRGGGRGGYGSERDRRGTERGRGYGAGGAASSSSRRDKEFVDLFNKGGSNNRRDSHGTHKTYQSYKSHRLGKLGKYLNDEYEGEGLTWSPSSEYYNLFDKEDDTQLEDPAIMTVNQCWERASKLFKKPNKALVIPPPENLAMYLEKKYPKSRWPRGSPVASRNYPNGSVFVSQYASGSSRVFYPHGGLAVIISAPSPATSRVLVVKDPSDHIFFFDKALLADLNSGGKGTIYGDDGVVKLQYSPIGGFKLDGLERGQRWQWHRGGVRMIMKLNKYISIRISDQNKIFLNFYGNMRGFLVNVASGREVILMNPDKRKKDPLISELRRLIRPKTMEDNFDYMRGKFNMPATLGFVDKAKHYRDALNDDERNIKGSQSARNLVETSVDLNQYFAPVPRRNRNIFTARSSTDPITYPDDFDDIARICRVSEEPCYDPNENSFGFQYCL